jgi:hypothetical protein
MRAEWPVGPRRRCVSLALSGILLASLFGGGASTADAARRKRTTKIARRCQGSSNPTIFSSSHRVARTSRGRLLAVYDPHGRGQQLVWRSRDGRWHRSTRGTVRKGFMSATKEADRPASIVVGRVGPSQYAWIVWSGDNFASGSLPVTLRRLSGLNGRGGPRVGPGVTLVRAGADGHVRTDIALERSGSGRLRAAVSWFDRKKDGSYTMEVGWITNLTTDSPNLHDATVVLPSRVGSATATLLSTSSGVRLIAVSGRGRLNVFRHSRTAPLTSWQRADRSVRVSRRAKPSAIESSSGRILVAVEGPGRGSTVKVVRYNGKGRRSRVVGRFPRRKHPVLSRVGKRSILVMIRRRDGALVSRSFARGRWKRERVDLRRKGSRRLAWPNPLPRSRRRLELMVQGAACPAGAPRNGVIGYSRRA